MKRLLSLIIAITVCAGAFAADKAVAVFKVNPPMSCQNCENKIKNNLRFEKGIKNIETSLEKQNVTVTYDPAKTNPESIGAALKKIGYEAVTDSKPCAKKHNCCGKADNCRSNSCTKPNESCHK